MAEAKFLMGVISTVASVFLLSYNKGEYVLEAMESVRDQTFHDWECYVLENSTDGITRELIKNSGLLADPRFIYVEIDVPAEQRRQRYTAAWLLNEWYPKAAGDYIFYISDDDLLKRDCLQCCVNDFISNPAHDVLYFAMEFWDVEAPRTPSVSRYGIILPTTIRTQGDLKGKIDGGQVAHRKRCLDKLTQPYFREVMDNNTGSADGYFLEKLAQHHPFYPFMKILAIHRTTPFSTWTSYHGSIGRIVNGSSRPTIPPV